MRPADPRTQGRRRRRAAKDGRVKMDEAAKKARDDRLIQRAMQVLEQRMVYGPAMQSPVDVREYLALRFAG